MGDHLMGLGLATPRWASSQVKLGLLHIWPQKFRTARSQGPSPEPVLSGPIYRALCPIARGPEQVVFPEYTVTTNSSVTAQPGLQKAGASSLLVFSNSSEAGPQAQ